MDILVFVKISIIECHFSCIFGFFQAEDGIRDLVRSRGLGDVYKRQGINITKHLIILFVLSIIFSPLLFAQDSDAGTKKVYRFIYSKELFFNTKTEDAIALTKIFTEKIKKQKGIEDEAEICLLYTSDAADERSSVDLGGRRIIKKKNKEERDVGQNNKKTQ